MNVKQMKKNIEERKNTVVECLYSCPVGSAVCTLCRLNGKGLESAIDIFTELKDDKVFHRVENIRQMVDYIIIKYFPDFTDYDRLMLLHDETHMCSPTIVALDENGTLSPIFRFDEKPTRIAMKLGLESPDIHLEFIFEGDDENA